MNHCSDTQPAQASPFPAERLAALSVCSAVLVQLAQAIHDFRAGPITPLATQQFEEGLQRLTRELGRVLLEDALNSLEPDEPELLPEEITVAGTRYRRRFMSPARVDSTFGTFGLRRWLYEPREAGERCLFPMELLLGVVAGLATPALADRVGRLVAVHPQRAALRLLKEDNGLVWSHALLRKVAACVAVIAEEHREAAQQEQLLSWLKQAYRSKGPHEPVLAAGRDGIMVPICGCKPYQEASVATVAVYDRNGKRLGTAYLGCMPQALQQKLSKQLTSLLKATLLSWKGRLPRLVYLSDGGQTPENYYNEVLRKMRDPRRPGERLVWQRVLDYYHAAEHLGKLADALFGEGWQARAWARRMRRVLKQHGGLTRVLQSAAYHRNEQKLSGARQKKYNTEYNYLHKRRKFMDYAAYKGRGLPIGSGVTEAGCKVVASQRLKLSGMKWEKPGGQTVMTLRVVFLSGVWANAWNSHISHPVNPHFHTYEGCLRRAHPAAA
jgi:hypothetical protein